jgi:drug/metabolite transporter (DMT)-like permease
MTGGSRSLGTLALIATAALWGSNHVVARAARDAAPLPALVFWRWLPAAIILTIVAWPALRRCWPDIRPRLGELVIGGTVGVGVFSFLLIGGAYQSPAIEVGFINATMPVWVVLLGTVMGGGQITRVGQGALALAFAGTILIICKGDPARLAGLQLNLGNLWSLLAAIVFAWFSIRVREWSRTIETLPLTVITAWAGLIVVLLPVYMISVASGGAWFAWTDADMPVALGAIVYTGLGPTMLGNAFYLYGVATNGPTRAAGFLYLSPLCTALFSVIWLGERPAWYHAVGFAAIIAGLVLLDRRESPTKGDQAVGGPAQPS